MLRALITGCSTGIGRATAEELGRRGYEVVATARNLESLRDLDIPVRLELDVTDPNSIREAMSKAGPIDVLVNNAGLGCWGPIEAVATDDVERLFDVNVIGVIRMVKAVLPGMRERGGGAIVNVSSAAGRGRRASAILGYYAATKHAVEMISSALRAEVNGFGIRVIVVEPGSIETNFAGNRIIAGADGPYAERVEDFSQRIAGLRATVYPPTVVAEIIADALAESKPVLRRPGSPDARLLIERAESLTEDEAEVQYWATVDTNGT